MATTRSGQFHTVIVSFIVALCLQFASPYHLYEGKSQTTYKAAVFDKAPRSHLSSPEPLSRREALGYINTNLDLFERQVLTAKTQGVDVIVFPEYGLYPSGTARATMTPFCEQVPEPGKAGPLLPTIPCLSPEHDDPRTVTQRRLSCMARAASAYVVANMCDRSPCIKGSAGCQEDGHVQYNTNVVYDPLGALVARYHKYNLFFEASYDTPPKPDYAVFDTPFGRFGTIVCFDVLFKEPTITLVEEYGVDTIVFPTAWMNVLPYFSAVPFHQAFSIGAGVNFLSSNIHKPSARFSGSGLYSPSATVSFRNDDNSDEAQLLIGKIPNHNKRIPPRRDITFPGLAETDPKFTAEVFGDAWSFVNLVEPSGVVSICHETLCCQLTYEVTETTTGEHFALGAFRGLHTKEGTYFLEMCGLLRCADDSESSCASDQVRTSQTHMKFDLVGNYTAEYIYPMVVGDNVDPSSGEWSWDGAHIKSDGTSKPLVSAIAMGRVYELDDTSVSPIPPEKPGPALV